MKYYNSNQSLSAKVIYFEQIDKKIERVHNLKRNHHKNKFFEIYYTEIFDDLDEEEFIIFRLDDLKLL